MHRNFSTMKGLIVLFMLVVLAFGAYGFFYTQLKNKAARVAGSASELAQQTDRESRLGSIELLVRDTQEERTEMQSRFVQEDDIVEFITNIENIGQQIGIVVDITSVEAEVPEFVGESGTLRLQTTFEGSWQDVVTTIGLLENQGKALHIVRAFLRSLEREEGSVWSVDVTLEALMFKYSE